MSRTHQDEFAEFICTKFANARRRGGHFSEVDPAQDPGRFDERVPLE
ncbi:hypothetical protein SAMN05216564_1191 [Halopenitus persicus]|uniref:Uncharacterized protein n=1 Tax=Halopenitus persicus TaxID=1048396 RepID=A0A1H3P3W7_9EURY|nr:hypothetical protein SAMN05216564_1191 [Halopenitus persicus]